MLFCHQNFSLLNQLLRRPDAGPNVVIPCLDAGDLIRVAAATEPHLVVVGTGADGVTPKELEHRLRAAGFLMPILMLGDGEMGVRQLDEIWQALRLCSHDLTELSFGMDGCQVLAESPTKIRSSEALQSSANSAPQTNRLLALLEAGHRHQQRAQDYFNAAVAHQAHHQSEWSLALLDAEAAAYLRRAHLFRYVSALAHFVPGVDVDCLPLPQGPSRKIDYLSNALSGEAFYALNAVRAFGITPQCDPGLWAVGQLQTKSDSKPDEVVQLAGWAEIMRQIVSATLRISGELLHDHPAGTEEFAQNPHRQVQHQIFCSFWNLEYFRHDAGQLWQLGKEFRKGRRAEGIMPYESFFDFAQRIQREENEQLERN